MTSRFRSSRGGWAQEAELEAAKIPHSPRYRVSLSGRRVMAATLKLGKVACPSLYAEAA
jgi:hypothetical protein